MQEVEPDEPWSLLSFIIYQSSFLAQAVDYDLKTFNIKDSVYKAV